MFEFLEPFWQVHYTKAVIVTVVAYLAMQIILFVFEKGFLRLAKKTETELDDELVKGTRKPLAFLVLMIGARIASESLEFGATINVGVERVISSIIILTVAHLVSKILSTLVDHWMIHAVKKTKGTLDDDLLKIAHRCLTVIVYTLAILYILSVWGVQIGPLLASLGVAGIAVAFALQATLANIFGGLSLILDKTIRIGDLIELEDGTFGKVHKMSLRSTQIKTFDGELMVIPNGRLADSKVTNWILPTRKVRITIAVGIEYGENPDKAKKVIMDLIKKEKNILDDPEPRVTFEAMGDFSLNLEAKFWVKDINEKIETRDAMNTKIYNGLKKAKIGIAFPTQTVHVKKG